jgi:hypothetical protein
MGQLCEQTIATPRSHQFISREKLERLAKSECEEAAEAERDAAIQRT